MNSINSSSKLSSSSFVFFSILVQLISIPVFYGILELIASLFSGTGVDVEFFFLKNSVINYAIVFSIIIVVSIQETTKSELLASVMHGVWILFIWSETSHYFFRQPVEYVIFILCLILTFSIRLIFQSRFQSQIEKDHEVN